MRRAWRLLSGRLAPERQVKAFWFCYLSFSSHVIGGPSVPRNEQSTDFSSDTDAVDVGAFATPRHSADAGADTLLPEGLGGSTSDDSRSIFDNKKGYDSFSGLQSGDENAGRELQTSQQYPFFTTTPYVNVVVFDSNGPECDKNYESPAKYTISSGAVTYWRDGTDVLRKRNMACGIAPARFVFYTSDLADYADPSVMAKMQVRIVAKKALFLDADTCEDVLDATGNFPSLDGCRFMQHEARLILATRLVAGKEYSVTLKLVQPAGRNTASANSFDMSIEFYQMKVIEGTKAPVDISHTIPNAKDESVYGGQWSQRGYVTSFTWQPSLAYTPTPGVLTKFTFGLRTFGVMGYANLKYAIDFVAYPTDVWKFGTPGEGCDLYSGPEVGTICELRSFTGALATESNGFRIKVGSTDFVNLGTGAKAAFSLNLHNPVSSINGYWTATSFQIDNNGLPIESYTVMLDKPISVIGGAAGEVAQWDLASIGVEQWIELSFTPGNTLVPERPGTRAGILVIIPPSTFQIVTTSNPSTPDLMYNALPCTSWPEADRLVGRWVCWLEDKALFKETVYRVRLKVRNPMVAAAARSWRVEVWQTDATKPISITRSIRGMPVSGKMIASVSQENQLIGVMNTLQFEFTPSQDVGAVNNTRLEVEGPPGFVIIKRCLGFLPIELPPCECQGNNANKFTLVMNMVDALKASITSSFKIDVLNPSANIPAAVNYWTFSTVRPDGVGKDTARYNGFSLYPYDFKSFLVLPLSRRTGSQYVVVRFTPKFRIPFDDYLRVRAPYGVTWDAGNLDFSSTNAHTDARTFGTKDATVIFDTPGWVVWQLTTSAESNFEYGIRANVIVPHSTPVPNMWWIEQYRQTGQAPPNQWRDIASMGGPGYKSQVLIKTTLDPFNIVAEAWQNPTLITFEMTLPVMPMTRVTALGTTRIPAELYLEAPAMFTYICPLAAFPSDGFPALPQYSQLLPVARCEVDHQNQAERNKLFIKFDTGLEAGIKYAFVIDIVNAQYINPANNKFILQTRLDGVMQEEAILPGFKLAQRMDNTRFLNGQIGQDNRVEMASNQVTFILGTTKKVTVNSILEIKAPIGFKFNYDCTQDVGRATWVANMLKTFPIVQSCQNQQKTLKREVNIAQVFLQGTWDLGSYGVYVKVQNPMFTPLRNFWGFTIFDRQMEPIMSEAWVYGFPIQVILPDYYPGLSAYNPGNTISGEAASNIIDISFTLTTHLKNDGRFKVTSPKSFVFPSVCREFAPCLDCAKSAGYGVVKGSSPMSPFTKCTGHGANGVTLWDLNMDLLAKVMYSFRVMVVNGEETFKDTNKASLWWRYETIAVSKLGAWAMVDLHRMIPSFPIYQRLAYFVVDTVSKVGLGTTTLRLHFATTSPIPPQQTVTVTPPEGMFFYGVRNNDIDGACYNEDPVIISRLFPVPLISGVTRLPEWISCRVINPTTLLLKNEESILGGRPLISGPVYEVFLRNATNPQSSPYLNIFRIVAKTSTPLGQEVWASEGFVVFPELEDIMVASNNEGFGLYSTFTIQMKVITEVPAGGSIVINAPGDYYFGPVIFTALTMYDPLNAIPPPSGTSPPRPAPGTKWGVILTRSKGWADGIDKCPFDFQPCVDLNRPPCVSEIPEEVSTGCIAKQTECTTWQARCKTGALEKLMTAVGYGSSLEITFLKDVALPARTVFRFQVQGYNTRLITENRDAPNGGGNWNFLTRDSDSEKTTLDRKSGVTGIYLMGVIFMDTMYPGDIKIGVVENRVKMTIRLAQAVPAKARLRIIHPKAFMRNSNAAFAGALIILGTNFPRSVEKTTTQNIITLVALDEAFVAMTPLEIDVGLSNPAISPAKNINIWSFETSSFATGAWVKQNCNRNVSGFKIFGEFGTAQVTSTVLSPEANTIIGVRFVLKSGLPFSSTSRMRLWMPPGWMPLHECGTGDKIYPYTLMYDPMRANVKYPFPSDTTYFDLPSGTYCYRHWDEESGTWYVELIVDGIIDYGLDYAFEFGGTNPRYTPAIAKNVWRYETLMNGVILHLRPDIPGFTLEEIKEIHVRPSDTTTLSARDRIEFYMMSDKAIPGGSTITITAPHGYSFMCALFNVVGLASTTTCYKKANNIAAFTLDSQDPKKELSPFQILVYTFNPEFTPRINTWKFDIVSELKRSIDRRDDVSGFDITGKVQVSINPLFPYLGQTNPLRVTFVPSTIMNQADEGNELVLTGPPSYLFGKNCTGFYLRLTNQPAVETTGGYPSRFQFPPPGITCTGFDNSSVVIRLPDSSGLSNTLSNAGGGLLKNNYTLEIDVLNPVNHSEINEWSFLTRVRNPSGQRIVDANRTLGGFKMNELVPLNLDESAAPPRFSLLTGVFLLMLPLLVTRSV